MRQVTLAAALSGLLLASPLIARAQDRPAIIEAVTAGNHATLRTLIASNANVDATQGDGATALHWAAHRNDADAVRLLLDAGASANAANDLGATPLWLASTSGPAALVQALLDAGADPNVTLRMGETPLMAAARSGNLPALKLLIDRGADVNATEREREQTALMWAAAQRHADAVRLLVDHGADLQARTAVWNQLENSAGNTNASGNFNLGHGGSTPLLFVARNGDVETARTLVALGANVNDTAASGNTALVIAAHGGHGPLGIYLLEQGADPNAADGGYTALHAAVLRGELDLVQSLLDHGASPNARLERGTPGRRLGADYSLRHQFVGANPFWLAARYGEPEILSVLAEHGADPNMTPRNGVPSLQAAIGTSKMGYYRNRRDRAGIPTPDPADAEKLALELARIAVDSGVDINAVDDGGNTALHDAVRGGFGSVIELLAARGADLDIANADGQTALALAELRSPGDDDSGSPAPPSVIAELLRRLGATAVQDSK